MSALRFGLTRLKAPGNGQALVEAKRMIALLLVLLLLVLLFGGLGIFVAKVFLFGLLLALIVGVVAGYGSLNRRGV
jgi:hypothetical protein